MTRGYACIGLLSPKCDYNVGGVLRAAGCYGASLVVIKGQCYSKMATDTMAAYKRIPVLKVDDLLAANPYDCVPVAVDLIPGSRPLHTFKHPARAYYIFGPEDGTLGGELVARCKHVVSVPTHGCMNLAATVNVVLYDRLAKLLRESDATGLTEGGAA
jgi:tRNA(Leu) C34 or U34 (ribose-2'-O)-methylase TrmL